jgi:hypothetical protein
MPNGKVARAGGAWQRIAAALWSEAAAITGAVSPVVGTSVDLVELRQEDLDNGTQPGSVGSATTGSDGAFCIGLAANTDQNVCRYMLQVGSADDHTLTRAFVFSTTDKINIDFRSEATVRLILAQIPPATLCDFTPDEIRSIYDAVVAAPGTATGANASEINAVAETIAAADPGVQAAIAAAYTPPTPTETSTPTATGPTPTRTPFPTETETYTPRSTRTPLVDTPTLTPPRTRTPTDTATPVGATPSPVPATATATPSTTPPQTSTPTSTPTPLGATPSPVAETSTPTPSATTPPTATGTPTAGGATPSPVAQTPTPTPSATTPPTATGTPTAGGATPSPVTETPTPTPSAPPG